jgi:hypothetical protein
MLLTQPGADLLTLPMIKVALEPHPDHQIITNDAVGHDALDYAICSAGYQFTRGVATFGRAHPYRLIHIECSMRDASPLVLETLLYAHGPLADLATTGLLLCRYHYVAQIENALYKAAVQCMHLLPERR